MRYSDDTYLDGMFANRSSLAFDVLQTNRVTDVVTERRGLVETMRFTRELAGDLPEDVTLVGGALTASGSITIDGAMTGAPHPSKRADRLAWVGSDVEVWAGFLGSAELEVFTGRVRSFGFDESAYDIDVTLTDGSDRLRAPVSLPAFGSRANRLTPTQISRYPTNLSAIVVHALHACGVRMTPAPHALCVYHAPLIGGLIAERGWTLPQGAGVDDDLDWLGTGPFGPLPLNPSGGYWTAEAYPSKFIEWGSTASRARVHCWLNTTGGYDEILILRMGTRDIRLEVASTTSITARVWHGTGWTTTTVSGLSVGWHQVAFTIDLAGAASLWVDGATSTATVAGFGGSTGEVRMDYELGRIQSLSLLMWTTFDTPPPLSTTPFVPQADVDVAILDVDVLPVVTGRVAWELLKEVASAELGMVGHDEAGRFYFRSRDTINASTTPVVEWDTDLVDNLSGSASVDSVRTRITAPYTPLALLGSNRGGETEETTAIPVAVSDRVLTFPNGFSDHVISANKTWQPDSSAVTVVTSPGQVWDVDNALAVSTDSSGTTRYTGSGIIARLLPLSATSWILRVNNSSGSAKYAAWPAEWNTDTYGAAGRTAGDPSFFVNGHGLTGEYTTLSFEAENAAAVTAYGDRVLPLPESPWRQNSWAVDALATRLLADLAEPRMQVDDITVPADLRWEIGDPVRLKDWYGRVEPVTVRMTRMVLTFDRQIESGLMGTYSFRSLPEA